MNTEHDPTVRPKSIDLGGHGPLAVRVERDGGGSASFDWEPVVDVLTLGLEQLVRSALGHDVSIVGIRFVDADGRATTGPAPTGITLVGFTQSNDQKEIGQ
jgi:hypothetical protein